MARCCGHKFICGSDVDAGGGPVCHGRDGSGADAMRVTFCKKTIQNFSFTFSNRKFNI